MLSTFQGEVPLAAGFGGGEQTLTDDGSQAEGQERTDITLGFLRKDVGEAGDGPFGVPRVQRAEDEVARFGGTERHLGGFLVPDFADQDNVRILPQAVLETVGESQHVGPHFPLRDHGAGDSRNVSCRAATTP